MPKQLGFEKRLDTLERIVEELESGGLTLDEALERYERGVTAHKECMKILAAAEKRVELLLKDDSGQLHTQPADAEGQANEDPA